MAQLSGHGSQVRPTRSNYIKYVVEHLLADYTVENLTVCTCSLDLIGILTVNSITCLSGLPKSPIENNCPSIHSKRRSCFQQSHCSSYDFSTEPTKVKGISLKTLEKGPKFVNTRCSNAFKLESYCLIILNQRYHIYIRKKIDKKRI